MAAKQFNRIVVRGEDLAQAIAYGSSEKCLDFRTGNIVLATDCAESDLGEGRSALKKEKRFVRIPTFDEMRAELKARYDIRRSGDDAEHLNARATLHEELAAEETALRWIAWLEPNVMVAWSEEVFGITRVYDPADKTWHSAF